MRTGLEIVSWEEINKTLWRLARAVVTLERYAKDPVVMSCLETVNECYGELSWVNEESEDEMEYNQKLEIRDAKGDCYKVLKQWGKL